MTDEQINAAIAEACGWKCAGHLDQLKATSGYQFGYQFVLRPDGQLVTHNSIPNYCADLNAMHEAENSLIGDLWIGYVNKLADIEGSLFGIRATARQRAEALLRTLGKWEEATDKESLTVGATTEDSSVDQEREQP